MTDQRKDDLFICRRTVGGGEYEGATCYYVYTPIESYVSPPVPDDDVAAACKRAKNALEAYDNNMMPYLSGRDLNIIIHAASKPPVDTTDGDAEMLLNKRFLDTKSWLLENAPEIFKEQKHLDAGTEEQKYWHYGYFIALRDIALQTRTPPVPVDTISIKREVLQEVRKICDAVLYLNKANHNGDLLREAIASLDAVLAEGE